MKKVLSILLVLGLVFAASPVFADDASMSASSSSGSGDYQENMKRNLVRGFKNTIGAVLEIPITVQEYHEQAGKPVIRHVAGALDGGFQAIVRLGSGLWDFVAAFIPNHQEGMPVDPETLF